MWRFMRTMFVNGPGLAAWIAALMTLNLVLPVVYITTVEGQVALLAFVAAAMTQMALFARKGFVRLLGVGHVVWVPLVPWLWSRLDVVPPGDLFGWWILALVVLNSLSLMIDLVDVVRYVAGDRDPHLQAG